MGVQSSFTHSCSQRSASVASILIDRSNEIGQEPRGIFAAASGASLPTFQRTTRCSGFVPQLVSRKPISVCGGSQVPSPNWVPKHDPVNCSQALPNRSVTLVKSSATLLSWMRRSHSGAQWPTVSEYSAPTRCAWWPTRATTYGKKLKATMFG
jgi:hypothetical protein